MVFIFLLTIATKKLPLIFNKLHSNFFKKMKNMIYNFIIDFNNKKNKLLKKMSQTFKL